MDFAALYAIQNEAEQVNRTYDLFNEDARLNDTPAARVEFLTTMRVLERYLRPGARVLDLGAGAGQYSFALARQGYAVDALELADRNVAVFRQKLQQQPGLPITLRQGTALDLSAYADHSYDLVLVFGPLYHLHAEADRQRCIAEARRVCRPDGVVCFAFINNDMVILTELGYDPAYLAGDSYDHETFKVEDFPFVFHDPAQCRRMLRAGGMEILAEVAADGLSELMAERINGLDEPSYRQYLRYHWAMCEKPEMLGHSNHLLFVTRPEDPARRPAQT